MKIFSPIVKWFFVCVFVSLIIFLSNIFFFHKTPIDMTGYNSIYVWSWDLVDSEKRIALIIGDNWYMKYINESWNSNISRSWAIMSLWGWEMRISFWLFSKTYQLSVPLKNDDTWQIIMEGEVLSRTLWSNELVIPSKDDLKLLLDWSFSNLWDAIRYSSFDTLFQNTFEWFESRLWDSVVETFTDINSRLKLESKITLDEILLWDYAILNDPYISKYWQLIIQWKFINTPEMYYKFEYLYEYPHWKLSWISVNFDQPY